MRTYTDENDQSSEQDLLVNQEGEGKVPIIRGDDDLIALFYSLVVPAFDRLTPFEGAQQLIFSLGAAEVKANIDANGQVSFDNLEQINYLDPTDLLTIRLYANNDAANTLWEWAFTRNGLHVLYQVPGNTQKKSARAIPTVFDPQCIGVDGKDTCDDIEVLAILESKDPKAGEGDLVTAKKEQEIKVRTLGGMRLRYRYIPPSLPGLKMTKVTWKINHLGRYCKKYGVEDAGDCEEREADKEYEQKQPNAIAENIDEVGDWSIYWEPLTEVTRNGATVKEIDWSNWAGTNTDDTGVAANLNAEYTVPVTTLDSYGNSISNPDGVTRYYKSDFTLHTRELKPAANGSDPMQGSDVAMLEAMLWDFGISPQKGTDYQAHSKAGISGSRMSSEIARCDGSSKNSRYI